MFEKLQLLFWKSIVLEMKSIVVSITTYIHDASELKDVFTFVSYW